MYQTYYNLKKTPFSFAADPSFTYETKNFSDAFFHLLYGIERMDGIVVITGNIGTGKTMLCNFFLNKLRKEKKDYLISLSDPLSLGNKVENLYNIIYTSGFLERGLDSAEISYDIFRKSLIDLSEMGKKTILIIDEADKLSVEMLQNLSLVSNIEKDGKKLLQIVIVGEVNLLEKLKLTKLRQLNQRVSVKYKMKELKKRETGRYINYRIKVAGDDGMISFAPKSIKSIHRYTGGCQRLVNLVCDRALLKGMVSGTPVINKSIVKYAINTLSDSNKSFFSKTLDRFNNAYGAFALSVCFMGLAASLYSSHLKFDIIVPQKLSLILPVKKTTVKAKTGQSVNKINPSVKNDNSEPAVLVSVEQKELAGVVTDSDKWVKTKELKTGINGRIRKDTINKFLLSAGLSVKNHKNKTSSLNENILVSVRSARLRNAPSLEAPIIHLVKGGVLLKKIEVADGWTKVLFSGKDEYGWISNSIINSDPDSYLKELFLSAGSTLEQTMQDNKEEVFVNVMVGRVRKTPSLYSNVLTRKEFGTIFKKVEDNGNWTKVEISANEKRYGWIKNTIISNNPNKVINDFLVSIDAFTGLRKNNVSLKKDVFVSVSVGKIRTGPSLVSSVLTMKRFGTVLQKVGDDGMWTKVILPDHNKNIGWIHKSIIKNVI